MISPAAIYRGLFLMDGSSDEPLAALLEELCLREGATVRIAAPDLRRLPNPPGLSVQGRLEAALELDDRYDLIFVHRDAEKQDPETRKAEVSEAAAALELHQPVVCVVPVRMTEAWLLLDETEIRAVAGRPSSRVDLCLPQNAEAHPDPKECLQTALIRASETTGRRLTRLKRRFPEHRRQLLERLDIDGPVTGLASWQSLVGSIRSALAKLEAPNG